MSPATITALQAVAVAALVFLGQWVVARISKSATSETTSVTSQEKATEAWRLYAERMESRLAAVEQREEENRRRISALERERDRDRDLIRRLLDRLRRAHAEIRRLGGTVSEADTEVADLALHRLDLEETRP